MKAILIGMYCLLWSWRMSCQWVGWAVNLASIRSNGQGTQYFEQHPTARLHKVQVQVDCACDGEQRGSVDLGCFMWWRLCELTVSQVHNFILPSHESHKRTLGHCFGNLGTDYISKKTNSVIEHTVLVNKDKALGSYLMMQITLQSLVNKDTASSRPE